MSTTAAPSLDVDLARRLDGPSWLAERRIAAVERWTAGSRPTDAQEVWRYSRVDELELDGLRPAWVDGAGETALPSAAGAAARTNVASAARTAREQRTSASRPDASIPLVNDRSRTTRRVPSRTVRVIELRSAGAVSSVNSPSGRITRSPRAPVSPRENPCGSTSAPRIRQHTTTGPTDGSGREHRRGATTKPTPAVPGTPRAPGRRHGRSFRARQVGPRAAGSLETARRVAAQPTAPSMLSSMSRDSSTAYSIGSVLTTGSMKPLTIMAVACCSERPRLMR